MCEWIAILYLIYLYRILSIRRCPCMVATPEFQVKIDA